MAKRKYVTKQAARKKGRYTRKFRPGARKRSYRRLPPLTGFANSKLVRLKYVQQISINAGAGSSGTHVFRANSLYDPDFSGTGSQPRGFDELMQFYNHYQVKSAKMTAEYVSDDSAAATNIPAYMGIALTDDGVQCASKSIPYLKEMRQTKTMKIVGGAGDYNNPGHRRCVCYFSHKKFFRGGARDKYMGSTGANPAEAAYFELFIAPLASADPAAKQIVVTIEFIALVSEPRVIAQS